MKPATVYWMDGSPVEARCASEGVQFAYGLFETLRFEHGVLEQPLAHLNRLNAGLNRLGLKQTICLEHLVSSFENTWIKAGIDSGALKVLALRRGSPAASAAVEVQLYFRHNPYAHLLDGGLSHPYTLTISPYVKNTRSPVTGLKWLGYADHLLEKDRAAASGFMDALFLSDLGHVSETTVANLFWFRGEELHTPSTACGLLPGIMRSNVLAAARRMGLGVREGEFDLEALMTSDFVFATNSLMGLHYAGQVDQRVWPRPSASELKRFRALSEAVKAEILSAAQTKDE